MEHGKYQIWYWYVNITKCTELWNYQLTIKAVGPTSMTKSNCNILSVETGAWLCQYSI